MDSKPFQFELTQVQELTLSKFDPITGDEWLAVFKKIGNQWRISSPPSNQSLLDLQADETFINHLIDTFKSMRIVKEAPNGPLASFQLSPPRFGIQIKIQPKSQSKEIPQNIQKYFEFKVGSRLQNSFDSYITLDDSKVFIAGGSTFRMLDLIQDFSVLRKKNWTTLAADDVDEVEVKKNNKILFYAQREGSQWTSRTHQLLKEDLNSWVQKATGTPTTAFIDQTVQAEQIRKALLKKPLLEIVLYPRKGRPTSLTLGQYQNHIYGLNSARPQAVLTFDPKLVTSLSTPLSVQARQQELSVQ